MSQTLGAVSETLDDVRNASRQGHEARFFVPVPSAVVSACAAVGERLSGAVGRLAVVCAPAGCGKTSQIAVWAASDPRPVAWVDLGRVDNDPVVLLAGLVKGAL